MTKKNAPAPAATGNEGEASSEGHQLMNMIARKYADYTTRVGRDSSVAVHYGEQDGAFIRWHTRIFRTPSTKEFLVRSLAGSTEAEKRRAAELVAQMPEGLWAHYPADRWHKWRAEAGYYYWILELGTYVDDPFVQLELEMMIDRSMIARVGDS